MLPRKIVTCIITAAVVYMRLNLWGICGWDGHSMSHLMTKATKWHVRPAKTQISLGIRPVCRVFTVRMKKAWVLSYPLSARWRLWSYWKSAQADLSLRWAHMPFCWFCHEAAHISFVGMRWSTTCLRRVSGKFWWTSRRRQRDRRREEKRKKRRKNRKGRKSI